MEKAFRFVSTGKHRGKVLIHIRTENGQGLTPPQRSISAVPKIFFDSEKSYVIIGGLGGIGLELANWMISKGATKIVLNSRRGITNGYQTLCLTKWENIEGIQVLVNSEDSTNREGAENLIRSARCLGSVGGKFPTHFS